MHMHMNCSLSRLALLVYICIRADMGVALYIYVTSLALLCSCVVLHVLHVLHAVRALCAFLCALRAL